MFERRHSSISMPVRVIIGDDDSFKMFSHGIYAPIKLTLGSFDEVVKLRGARQRVGSELRGVPGRGHASLRANIVSHLRNPYYSGLKMAFGI